MLECPNTQDLADCVCLPACSKGARLLLFVCLFVECPNTQDLTGTNPTTCVLLCPAFVVLLSGFCVG